DRCADRRRPRSRSSHGASLGGTWPADGARRTARARAHTPRGPARPRGKPVDPRARSPPIRRTSSAGLAGPLDDAVVCSFRHGGSSYQMQPHPAQPSSCRESPGRRETQPGAHPFSSARRSRRFLAVAAGAPFGSLPLRRPAPFTITHGVPMPAWNAAAVTALILLLAPAHASAQYGRGGGLFRTLSLGPRVGRDFENHAWSVGAQVSLPVGQNLELRPSGDLFFPRDGDTGWQANGDAAIHIGQGGGLYGGGGIAF